MDILPASDGQTPSKIIVNLKDEDQMNKLFENLKKDVLNDTIKYLGKQEFLTQEDGSGEDIIDLEPLLSGNNYKHKITNETLINELKESVKKGNVEVMVKEKTWKDQDNILHKTCELKVIKKTVVKSYNRLTTIIVFLIFFLILSIFLFMIISHIEPHRVSIVS